MSNAIDNLLLYKYVKHFSPVTTACYDTMKNVIHPGRIVKYLMIAQTHLTG